MSEARSFLSDHAVETTITAAVAQVLKEKPSDPIRRIGQILLGSLPASAEKVELTAEAKELMSQHGWDQGMVGFGSPASESTVRVRPTSPLLPCRTH